MASCPLRAAERDEGVGLDVREHGEEAYGSRRGRYPRPADGGDRLRSRPPRGPPSKEPAHEDHRRHRPPREAPRRPRCPLRADVPRPLDQPRARPRRRDRPGRELPRHDRRRWSCPRRCASTSASRSPSSSHGAGDSRMRRAPARSATARSSSSRSRRSTASGPARKTRPLSRPSASPGRSGPAQVIPSNFFRSLPDFLGQRSDYLGVMEEIDSVPPRPLSRPPGRRADRRRLRRPRRGGCHCESPRGGNVRLLPGGRGSMAYVFLFGRAVRGLDADRLGLGPPGFGADF